MFNTTCPGNDQKDETHFHAAVSCIAGSLKTQIISRSYDEVAICFFNTDLIGLDGEDLAQFMPSASQKNLLGEDLGPLNSKELEQLEHQLESSLKHVRSTKTQYMLDQLSELQNKEQMLMETNRALSIKLEEISARNQLRVSWEGGEQSVAFTNQQAQSMGLFQPLECNPTLQIGIHI